MSDTAFSSLNLPPTMLSNLADLGYNEMTPIQARSLPHVLDGKDLIAKAKTGSGKTAAFAIGLLLNINQRDFGTQALVICPTRELSTQVAQEIRRLARFKDNLKLVILCGGQSVGPQIGSLEHGAHIIVGTPGRIQDLIRKGKLDLSRCGTVVLDEADRMLDMGFYEQIEGVINHTPKQRQTLLFSATYPDGIKKLSADLQRDPVEVTVEAVHSTSQIEQSFYALEQTKKPEALARILSHFNPESTVIFCNTKDQCREVSEHLRGLGYFAAALHGDLDQRDRDQVLVQFSNRSNTILIATDVAARGLDISDLSLVINYDLPRDPEIYVHRIGRTGRAGKEGMAISLFRDSEQYKMDIISEYLSQTLETKSLSSLKKTSSEEPVKPVMRTLCIAGGRKDKIRPGDILGALTGEAGIDGSAVGKINIYDYAAYVAVKREEARKAHSRLLDGKIKGRRFKVRML
ncbi:ATP-dependent RNA helicase DbpA [Amphritea opalescens]|uniref:ATP-dependent RNA helicase DbpA n=1 Tax=Amphritea opalescens TaxID=2490544 RepID=A0A430KUT3_9GAMM|nr:ATP-dependent RNA helicase DbpA [Amphritea opalescens]RTE67218.1 ATP-dependent RNA helicase DbpA [Amphritea opalescens]